MIATRWATLEEVRLAGLMCWQSETTPRHAPPQQTQHIHLHPSTSLNTTVSSPLSHNPLPPKKQNQIAAEMEADPQAFTQWFREELPLLPRAQSSSDN